MADIALDFSKAFDTVPHNILQNKLPSCGKSRFVVCSVEYYLKGRAQRVVPNGTTPDWRPVTVLFLKAQFQGQSCSIFISMIQILELNRPAASLLTGNWRGRC